MSPRPAAGKTIALVGRAADPRVGEAMRALAEHLAGERSQRCARSRVSLRTSARSAWSELAEAALVPGCDLVVAIGGDGTMLHAARLAASRRAGARRQSRPARLSGRRRARTDARKRRRGARRALSAPSARMLLEAAVRASGRATSAIALNDVVVVKRETGRMLELRHLGRRRLRQHARRRRPRRRDLDRLDCVRPLVRRPDRAPEPGRAGARADLPAHAVGPADRRAAPTASSNSSSPSASTRAPRSCATACCSASSSRGFAC